MDKEELIKLYELTLNESNELLKRYENKISFFWKIISSIFAGFVIGIFGATKIYHFVILMIAPIIVILISYLAKKALYRDYLNFLERVTLRAKIEDKLGLMDEYDYTNLKWRNEPLIPLRYFESRNNFNTSEEFIQYHITEGYQAIYYKMFNYTIWLSICLIMMIFIVIILKYF